MPAITPRELIDAILNAFQDSGASGILLSPPVKHPRKFILQTHDGAVDVWVYAWTLTHGGRPNLPDEFRIQMTTVASPLSLNTHGFTVLLGYDPNLHVFAGFDLNRHRTFTKGSPSVQVDRNCLLRALQDGLAFDLKNNAEIAVGIRSDQLVNYIANARELHHYGTGAKMATLLSRASSMQPIRKSQIVPLPGPRKRVLAIVSRLARAASFRQQVLDAYGHRCAVTRMQLRLVDAAHILPVGAPGSSDTVQNGIALSPTFHRAFDNSLIYLDTAHVMRINPAKEQQLQTLRLDGGIVDFKSHLGRRIQLPTNSTQWPTVNLISRANDFRRIP